MNDTAAFVIGSFSSQPPVPSILGFFALTVCQGISEFREITYLIMLMKAKMMSPFRIKLSVDTL